MSFRKQPKLKHNSLHQANKIFDWNVLLTLQSSIISLDGGLDDHRTYSIKDKSQQVAIDRLEAKIDVQDALKQLTDIEVDVIRFRYGMTTGEPKSFHHIGEYFGFSATKANKIHDQAIQKLRQVFAQL